MKHKEQDQFMSISSGISLELINPRQQYSKKEGLEKNLRNIFCKRPQRITTTGSRENFVSYVIVEF